MSNTSATPKCHYCGALAHDGLCPRIAAIEYFEDGVTIKRIEFHAPQTPSLDLFPPTILTGGILSLEDDESFRQRVIAACGTDSIHYETACKATGSALELIGSFYEISRKQA